VVLAFLKKWPHSEHAGAAKARLRWLKVQRVTGLRPITWDDVRENWPFAILAVVIALLGSYGYINSFFIYLKSYLK
jgi:hypothetical protein